MGIRIEGLRCLGPDVMKRKNDAKPGTGHAKTATAKYIGSLKRASDGSPLDHGFGRFAECGQHFYAKS